METYIGRESDKRKVLLDQFGCVQKKESVNRIIPRYKMRSPSFMILCFANDVVIAAENDACLQPLIYRLNFQNLISHKKTASGCRQKPSDRPISKETIKH